MKFKIGEFTKNIMQDSGFKSATDEVNDNDIFQCLCSLKIISENEQILDYQELASWERGGDETFIAKASIRLVNPFSVEEERIFIAKAVTALGPSIDTIASTWLKRRSLLQKYMGVPLLYSYQKGVIYEEFIPYATKDLLMYNRDFCIRELAKVAYVLDSLGFQPLDIIPNVRGKADKLAWIDFGSDLGEPGAINTDIGFSRKILENEIELTASEKTSFLEVYELLKTQTH
jgi:hypothetical protein